MLAAFHKIGAFPLLIINNRIESAITINSDETTETCILALKYYKYILLLGLNSKMNNWLSKIPNRYWAYISLMLWGALSFMLLHKTSYGIDEGAAHALLLVWSVSDNVVSPVVTMGLPDFRTIFLVPAGILWTGNVLAAKVTTLLVMSVAAWSIHAWRHHKGDAESALIATGLLLVSPLVLNQIDTISVATYLLISFALGAWSDFIYRESKQAFGGLYFAQIFLCLVCITLHPIGLAYPLALLWAWHKTPLDPKHRNYFFTGVTVAALMALALTSGWSHVEWFANPIRSLSSLLLGPAEGDAFGAFHWICGVGMLFLLLLVIWKQARNLWADFLGRILLLSLMIGILVGDNSFAVIALVCCLYWGLPLLLRKPTISDDSFWKQRGWALVVAVIISTTFMAIDRANYQSLFSGNLSPRDSLIKIFAEDSGLFLNDEPGQEVSAKKPTRVASQWPGLTMLACRCDALPLPPIAPNSEALFTMLRGIDYLIFDPRDPVNFSLSRNLATMEAGKVETLDLQQGGVIIQIKKSAPAISEKKS